MRLLKSVLVLSVQNGIRNHFAKRCVQHMFANIVWTDQILLSQPEHEFQDPGREERHPVFDAKGYRISIPIAQLRRIMFAQHRYMQ